MTSHLTPPHGGTLVNLMAGPERVTQLKAHSKQFPSWSLKPQQMADLEALLCGAFSPLAGFMGRRDHDSVVSELRLADGSFWPVPVTLGVGEELAKGVAPGASVALRDPEGVMIAVLQVDEVWDREGAFHLAGRLEGVEAPHHYDFVELRQTPAQLRERFATLGWRKVAGFHTEGVMHRAERELTLAACRALEANLLIHPAVGLTRPHESGHYSRIRALQAVAQTYPHHTAMLSLAPLGPRGDGAREILWQALVRQNYGCSHFIVRRGLLNGDVEAALAKHEGKLGIQLARAPEMAYDQATGGYASDGKAPQRLSQAELDERLAWSRDIPDWFSFPEVIRELKRTAPPRAEQGFTVFFSGLPSSGKSTLANVLLVKLLEIGGRPVTLLDGDLVRKNLSSELGFSREHRDLNIRRIGFVAAEITKNGGIAICAPIAPFDAVRKEVRAMIEPLGGFLLVHVTTPVAVCETRDRKGLYAKARAGIVKEFTGISDPYEVPEDASLRVDTTEKSPEECVQDLILHLEREGYVGTARE
jgi:sulfate adenylyltransferase